VFNWTREARSHTLTFADLGLPAGRTFKADNVLQATSAVHVTRSSIELPAQPPESVIVLRLTDEAVPARAPALSAQVPASARIGETLQVSAHAVSDDAPVVDFHWDFGDGTSADGARISHTYTRASDYRVRVSGKGVDGLGTELEFPVKVTGALPAFPNLSTNRREADAVQ
jgi:hypothetical protein